MKICQCYYSFFFRSAFAHMLTPFVKFLFIVLFYRKFRLCITKASGKAHTPKVARALRLPLGGSCHRR